MLTAFAQAPPSRDPWVGDLFGPEVRSLSAAPLADEGDLLPAERALVAHAGEARRREFATGRVLARCLLEELGFGGLPLLRGADRAPRWPRAISGSISHCADLCVVVVASREHVPALGVDVEPDEPLEPELWPSVCTARELAALDAAPEGERGRIVRLLFSAKEATYKCVRFVGGPELGFHDVEVSLERGRGRFDAKWRGAADRDRAGPDCSGRFAFRGRWIFTGVSLPKAERTHRSARKR
jgi:4'-phosphopantetheinyl transferase EntD